MPTMTIHQGETRTFERNAAVRMITIRNHLVAPASFSVFETGNAGHVLGAGQCPALTAHPNFINVRLPTNTPATLICVENALDVSYTFMMDRHAFIQKLELPPHEAPLRQFLMRNAVQPALDGGKAADIVDGALICFVAGLSGQQQSDVLNSALIAQLNSNKLHDRNHETEAWYDNYCDVMGHLGWVIQRFHFEKQNISSEGVTLNNVALNVLGTIASKTGLSVVSEALQAMSGLAAYSPAMQLWGSSSSTADGGNFQISVCEASGGKVVMPLMASYFHTEEHSSNYFFATYSSSKTEIFAGSQELVLDDDIYGQVRQQVIDKLGDRAKTFVADLDI